MSTWFWIAGKREREVLLRSINHLTRVREVVYHLKLMLEALSREKYDEARREFNTVDTVEKEADSIKRRIIDELSKGTFHPLDREDLLRLVLASDDIAAYAKAAARKLQLLVDLGHKLPVELLDDMRSMAEQIDKAVNILIDSVRELTKSIEKAITLSHMVEEIEERIDDMRIDTFKKLFKICGEKYNGMCALLKEIIDDLEMASDKCEDVGDIVRSIAVSHS